MAQHILEMDAATLAAYLQKNGVEKENVEKLSAQQIDGKALATLTFADLNNFVGIQDFMQKKTILKLASTSQAPLKLGKFGWIPRRVEASIAKKFSSGNFFVHISGRRRMGKTTTVNMCAIATGRAFLPVVVSPENLISTFTDSLKKIGFSSSVSSLTELGNVMITLVRNGTVIYLDELQRSSESFQEILQNVIDTLARDEFMKDTSSYGGIVVSGSFPTLVEVTIMHPSKPLYYRFTTRYIVEELTPEELAVLFKKFQITDPRQQLMYFTLFGGVPMYYAAAHEKGCLTNTATLKQVVEVFFCGSSQTLTREALKFYEESLSKDHLLALKTIAERKINTKKEQIEQVFKEFQSHLGGEQSSKNAANALEDLRQKYSLLGLVEPFKSGGEGRYVLQDNFLETCFIVEKFAATSNNAQGEKPLVLDPEVYKALHLREGFGFEILIGMAIAFRVHVELPALPLGVAGTMPYLIHQGAWDGMEFTKIGLVATSTASNTVILGSLKREPEKQDSRKHMRHVVNMFHHIPDFFEKYSTVIIAFISPTLPAEALIQEVEVIASDLSLFVASKPKKLLPSTVPKEMKTKKFVGAVTSLEQLMEVFMSPEYKGPTSV